MTTAFDTSRAAHEAQLQAHRRLPPERRGEIALEMSDAIRSLARTGIRERHPEYSDRQVAQALVALLYGIETARKVWPNGDVPVP